MREIKIKIYPFNELTPAAQQTALEEDRFINVSDYEWYEFSLDNFKEAGKLIGIDIDQIYFSGFHNQGDGACFAGTYAWQKNSLKAVKKAYPECTELHAMAKALDTLQRQQPDKIGAKISRTGPYSHEHCVHFDCYHENSEKWLEDETEQEFKEIMRDFMKWIYIKLEEVYNHLISDISVSQTLITSEFEYNELGKKWAA